MVSSAGLLVLGLISFLSGVDAQIAGKCTGQTCYIASLGASTAEPYKLQGGKKPAGGNAVGDRCIKDAYRKLGLPAPAGLKYLDLSNSSKFRRALDIQSDAESNNNLEEFYEELSKTWKKEPEVEESTLEKRQGCKQNTLLFARGTTEIGTMGTTVGPSLQSGLMGWSVQGISYSADMPGIYCLGLPGALKCMDQIKALVKRCPSTNIVLSGYSQGAMVVRTCAAWAGEAQKNIKGIATFGDPFNGADVKGIPQDKIKVWCNAGDGVCKGSFSIGAAHLSYTVGSTQAALTWIKGIVKK